MVGDAAPVLGVALLARGPGNLFCGGGEHKVFIWLHFMKQLNSIVTFSCRNTALLHGL